VQGLHSTRKQTQDQYAVVQHVWHNSLLVNGGDMNKLLFLRLLGGQRIS
jgi:hypothetical protein